MCRLRGDVFAACAWDFMYIKSDCTRADCLADAWTTTLVATDEHAEHTRMCLAMTAGSNLASNQYMYATIMRLVDAMLRHPAVPIQHHGEPAIEALISYVQLKRMHDKQDKCTLGYNNGSNGFVEAGIKQMQSQCKTMRLNSGVAPQGHRRQRAHRLAMARWPQRMDAQLLPTRG